MKFSIKNVTLVLILIILLLLLWYLFKPLSNTPVPAHFECLDLNDGELIPLDSFSGKIYGIGLAYAGHIGETASDYDPNINPPVFVKPYHTILKDGGKVIIPSLEAIKNAMDSIEPGLSSLAEKMDHFPLLMDYETEMGIILLESFDVEDLRNTGYAPNLAFFIANDISSRGLLILGEGMKNRYDYWGMAKGFPGFLPIGVKAWKPRKQLPNGIPCIRIETILNAKVMQSQLTSDLIYTPTQMLSIIADEYNLDSFTKGDIVLTGTPGGVLFSSARWMVRLANLLGFDRFTKFKVKTRGDADNNFLQPGDKVKVTGEQLGEVDVELSDGSE